MFICNQISKNIANEFNYKEVEKMTYELYFVKGANTIGKTQWMLQNIGCYPDLKFPTRFTKQPLHGIMNKLMIFPSPFTFPLYIYTDNLTTEELENPDLRS